MIDGAERGYPQLAQAQGDVRAVYRGGFVGQLVSGAVWLLATAAGSWLSAGAAVVVLWAGGVLIFPLTSWCMRLSGGPTALPRGHPMAALATQIAFTVPPGMLVAVALAQYRPEWFFPASMVIVGAHYLPFVFLYGERLFAILAVILVFAGVAIAVWLPGAPNVGGWFTAAVLVVFAFRLRASARASTAPRPAPHQLPAG